VTRTEVDAVDCEARDESSTSYVAPPTRRPPIDAVLGILLGPAGPRFPGQGFGDAPDLELKRWLPQTERVGNRYTGRR
jgi:hypothetical protein